MWLVIGMVTAVLVSFLGRAFLGDQGPFILIGGLLLGAITEGVAELVRIRAALEATNHSKDR
ncbi:MAG TPA: hypothetical protein VK191_16245 [Symbiobacteriaceae bacterium]|nr:hypothetical protein [Symbiobacteriaceae bacterium]